MNISIIKHSSLYSGNKFPPSDRKECLSTDDHYRIVKRISEVDLTDDRYIRAGIIPYVESRGMRYYAFGLSSHNGSIFDFGGHCEPDDEDLIETAIREFREESLGAFKEVITYDDIIKYDYEVIDGLDGPNPIGTLEILVPVNEVMHVTMLRFKQLVKMAHQPEMVNIIWLSEDQLIDIYRVQHPITVGNVHPFHTYYRIQIPINYWAVRSSQRTRIPSPSRLQRLGSSERLRSITASLSPLRSSAERILAYP